MKPIPMLTAAAALVLLAAACSGSPSSTGSGGSSNSPQLAFAQCMRSHGVPNFPDPQPGASNAKFPSARQLGVGDAQFQAAESACMNLLAAGANDQFPPAEVPLLLSGMREFSQCMRSDGVPNWPDPITDSEGRPVFDLGAHGITRGDARSPQVQAAMVKCQHLLPSALGGTPVGGP